MFVKEPPRGRRRRTTAAPGSNLAKARIAAHQSLDALWRFGGMTRSEAYRALARALHVHPDNCHIGMFDEKMCAKVVAACERMAVERAGDQ